MKGSGSEIDSPDMPVTENDEIKSFAFIVIPVE